MNIVSDSVHGEITKKREETRSDLAKKLIIFAFGSILACLIIGALLLWLLPNEDFGFKEMLNLLLAITTFWSGLLGSAMTFYFVTNE
ncbi:MAG: hypothetical protein ABIJ26_03550 [Candidatus Margulisiibacteriota bacterium]